MQHYNINKINIAELYSWDGLESFNQKFLKFLTTNFPNLANNNFIELKNNIDKNLKYQDRKLFLDLALAIEDFLVQFFLIEKEIDSLKTKLAESNIIYRAKRDFVQRCVAKKYLNLEFHNSFNEDFWTNFNYQDLLLDLDIDCNLDISGLEMALSKKIINILDVNANVFENLKSSNLSNNSNKYHQKDSFINEGCTRSHSHLAERLVLYSIWALSSASGIKFHRRGTLFKLPQKIDYQKLIPEKIEFKKRLGFSLTTESTAVDFAVDQARYCIICDKQGKDSCSKGLFDKENKITKDFFGANLAGCPLEQKISEMNLLYSQSKIIAALALICLDNPLVIATGNRICNDCSKSCIFQKQDAVDIPQIESKIIEQILALPYGFEIYSLLTKWNPLNFNKPTIAKYSGNRIMTVGAGVSGFTLSHYLLNAGHLVLLVDGLKIDNIDEILNLSGRESLYEPPANILSFKPIKDVAKIMPNLENRSISGFGGVAEYGITARWNKNFLTIIQIMLLRRANFAMIGGIRFGSTIDDILAFNFYKFDHIALALGAGKPKIAKFPDYNFAKGMRMASDFLMNLHLGEAFKQDIFSNLQIRMPAIVLGGGLTAVDSACEIMSYYQRQVKKFAIKTKEIIAKIGEKSFWDSLSLEQSQIAREFLQHASCEDLQKYLQDNKMVTLAYHKKINLSPAYRNNHKELIEAIAEGVNIEEEVVVLSVEVDSFENLTAVNVEKFDSQLQAKSCFKKDCRSLLIAYGTEPNITIVTTDKVLIPLERISERTPEKTAKIADSDKEKEGFQYFANSKSPEVLATLVEFKGKEFNFITKFITETGQSISYIGDLHPDFNGSVVKAMASAKLAARQIEELLPLRNNITIQEERVKSLDYHHFFSIIFKDFVPKIVSILPRNSKVSELIICSPLLTRNSSIAQIFNFKNLRHLDFSFNQKDGNIKDSDINYRLKTKNVPMTLLDIDYSKNYLHFMILNQGFSTNFINSYLGKQLNVPCFLMGPGGGDWQFRSATKNLLLASDRGNQSIVAIAKSLKEKKGENTILFNFQPYQTLQDIMAILEFAKEVIICNYNEVSYGNGLIAELQNKNVDINISFYRNNVASYLKEIAENSDVIRAKMLEIGYVFAIGNQDFLWEISQIYRADLKNILATDHLAIASINAPMQCMMKGICATCLQRRKTSNDEWEYFYSCASQDQSLADFDFRQLKWRCEQNNLLAKVNQLALVYRN